jgi:hypothetical protein
MCGAHAELVKRGEALDFNQIGRVPSMITAIADPGALIMRSARKTSDGLDTSASPLSRISNTPTSDVAPKRFLTERRSR